MNPLPPSLQWYRRKENRGSVSSSQVVSAAPSSPGRGLLTPFPWSHVGSLPWETINPTSTPPAEILPQAAVLHKQLQSGSSTGSQVLLQRGLLSSQYHWSCQEPAPVWASCKVMPGHTTPVQHNENFSPHRSYCWLVIRLLTPSFNCQ